MLSKTGWLLAAQWDKASLQYVLAKRHGSPSDLTVVAARSFEHTGENDYIAELLNAELEKHAARKPDVLVALSRSQVDLLPLELPPATDDELASLVSLQAAQHTSDATDDSMLGFLPLGDAAADDDAAQPRKVLAVTPQSRAIDGVRELLASVDLANLVRIGFRPLASLTLAQCMITRPSSNQPSQDPTPQRTLFVTLYDEQADLLLLEGQELQLNRSIHLPTRDDPDFVENLMSEIRRTEMVAPSGTGDDAEMDQSATSGSSIGQILACGGVDEEEIWRLLEDLAGVPVQLVSPLEYLPSPQKIIARESGRFAPLVGMLLEHTSDSSTVNFLNPRRPITPPNVVRRFGVYAAAAALALAMLGYTAVEQRSAADSELNTLTSQVAQAEKIAAKLQRRQRTALAVQQWQADDVNCLDELRDLSQRFPGQKDAHVQRMAVAPAPGGGKTVTLQVRVRDQALVSMMESNLRDAHHRIVSKRVSELSAEDDFGWQFDATILVTPRDADAYRIAFQAESDAAETARPQSNR